MLAAYVGTWPSWWQILLAWLFVGFFFAGCGADGGKINPGSLIAGLVFSFTFTLPFIHASWTLGQLWRW